VSPTPTLPGTWALNGALPLRLDTVEEVVVPMVGKLALGASPRILLRLLIPPKGPVPSNVGGPPPDIEADARLALCPPCDSGIGGGPARGPTEARENGFAGRAIFIPCVVGSFDVVTGCA